MLLLPKTLIILICLQQSIALYAGDQCLVPLTNETGRCIRQEYCEHPVKTNKNPTICGSVKYNNQRPLVCCPAPPGAFSQYMCTFYVDIRHAPQDIDLGIKASSKEFPHMVVIGYGPSLNNVTWNCGGTLISHYYILTAAHCTESPEFGLATWVRLGELDLQNQTEDANPEDYKIAEIIVHPDYKPPSYYHDIALLKLAKRIYFGTYNKPACLETQRLPKVDTLEVIGWGRQGLQGEPSSHLLKADLKLISHQTCQNKFKTVSTRKLPNGIVEDFQMCAGDAEGKDTCPGDSGGPLHYSNIFDKPVSSIFHYVVAGVTSFGKGCGGPNTVGVYTRVSSYAGWIENIVWPEPDY